MALVPSYIPRDGERRERARLCFAAMLAVLAGYLGLAIAQDGPIQVWLLVLAPPALLAAAIALHIIDATKQR